MACVWEAIDGRLMDERRALVLYSALFSVLRSGIVAGGIGCHDDCVGEFILSGLMEVCSYCSDGVPGRRVRVRVEVGV